MKTKKNNLTPRSPKYRTERADVFSYHSSRNRPETPSQRQEQTEPSKKKSGFKHIPTFIALTVIVASCIYASLLDTNRPNIIQISDTSPSILRSNEEYQKGVASIMSDSMWNSSKLTIDTNKVAQQIKEKYTEIGEVAVTIPLLGKRPVVQISPATPLLSITSRSGTYAVSEEGRVLLSASELDDTVKDSLIKVTDSLDINVKQGEYILPRGTISFIKEVKAQLNKKGQNIENITLPAIANEVHIKIEGQPFIIKFNLQNDVKQQVGSYFAVIESLSKNSQTAPAKEYIDVRVDGRVYYK